MDRGLYVAATGMLAEMNRQDALANNLANLTTPGFKADTIRQHEFASLLIGRRGAGDQRGTMSLGPQAEQVSTDRQGALRETSQPLDLALSGTGFFAVRDGAKVAYTRNGQFTADRTGRLTDAAGRPVLSDTGQPLQIGTDPEKVSVGQDGTVRVDGRAAGRLQVTELAGAEKTADSLWAGRPTGAAADVQVVQGSIETSTTDPTRTVVDMIASQRSFDASQRVLRAIDETLQRSAQLGSVQG